MDNYFKEFDVTDNRLSLELAELAPCQRMNLYIFPYVIKSANSNPKDEAYFSFEKFPDFSRDFLNISDVASNSVDLKVQLDSLRCIESLSVAITEQDSDVTLNTKVLDENSQETIRFENLNHETDYEIKILATPLANNLDQHLVETKVVRLTLSMYYLKSKVFSMF